MGREEAPASHAAPAVSSYHCHAHDMNPHLLRVNEWISDYKKLGVAAPSVIHHYCDRIETDSATTEAIFRVLDDSQFHGEVSPDWCLLSPLFTSCSLVPGTYLRPTVQLLPIEGGKIKDLCNQLLACFNWHLFGSSEDSAHDPWP